MTYVLLILAGLAIRYLIKIYLNAFSENNEEYIAITEKGRKYLKDRDDS